MHSPFDGRAKQSALFAPLSIAMTTCTAAFDAQASLLRVRKRAPAQQLALLPAPRNPRYISLDIWRGAACLAVVLSHSMIYLGAQTLSNRGDQIIAALGR